MRRIEINEAEVTRHWNKNATLWTEQVRQGKDIYREHYNNPAFLKFIGKLKGKLILDAGCGEGYNTRLLARNGARVVGVDISPRMIEYARQEEHKSHLGIRYEELSFSNLSLFDNETFDVVVSFMALMDSPDYTGAINEMFRVLRAQGELFFSITHPCFITKNYGWINNERRKPTNITVSNYFNRQSWIESWKFSESLEDVELFNVPVFPRTLTEYLNTLTKAGFTIKKIEEPRPTYKTCKEFPLFQKWRDHVPLFLYFHAVKA